MAFGSTLSGLKARSSWRVTKPQAVSRATIRRLVRNAFVLGGMWAIVPISFFEHANPGGQMLMTGLCAGMLAGGAFAFATIPVAAIGFMGPIFLGSAICIARSGDFVYWLIAVLVIVYACVLLRVVFAYSFEFTRRMIAHLETEKAVRQDSLTKLPNRFAFNESLETALVRLAGSGEEFAILLLDLDRFKEVNDQLGHLAGDEFLTQLAARLRRCTRDTDFVARIGGDEFGLIAANITKLDEAFKLAEEIISTFDHPFLIEGREIVGAATIGISLAPRDGNTSNDLLKHADVALYRAKKAGSGAIKFFEPGDDASTRERRELQRDLEAAIERNELFLVYQPFLDLHENRVTGFEALLRWRHPVRGLVLPAEFIPIAEESGLIHPIGNWVVRRASEALSHWPANIRVAVNGEVVVPAADGTTDFSVLQNELKGRSAKIVLAAFDLLYLNGYDQRKLPLIERKMLLKKIIAETDVQFSESFEIDGREMFRHACSVGLEGVVSKVRDSRYVSGRSKDWLKKTCAQ